MASGKTNNLELNQWAKTDPVSREEMNENFEKLDAELSKVGNCRIVKGTYSGNGKYGSSNPNTLNVGGEPIMVLIVGPYWIMAPKGATGGLGFAGYGTTGYYPINVTWTASGLSFYNTSNENIQCNANGTTYSYYAFFI